MSIEDREKTAFICPNLGLFQFTRMPFGLCGAPATFQHLMDKVIQGCESFCNAYLDDLVIYSKTWEDHLRHLRSILTQLKDAGLTVKLKKCQLAMEECVYLGHIIGGGLVKPEHHKTQTIKDYKIPVTKKEVCAFLGLTGYYRRFIPCYSEIAKPLTDLTRKLLPEKVAWSIQCQEAFEKLKRQSLF